MLRSAEVPAANSTKQMTTLAKKAAQERALRALTLSCHKMVHLQQVEEDVGLERRLLVCRTMVNAHQHSPVQTAYWVGDEEVTFVEMNSFVTLVKNKNGQTNLCAPPSPKLPPQPVRTQLQLRRMKPLERGCLRRRPLVSSTDGITSSANSSASPAVPLSRSTERERESEQDSEGNTSDEENDLNSNNVANDSPSISTLHSSNTISHTNNTSSSSRRRARARTPPNRRLEARPHQLRHRCRHRRNWTARMCSGLSSTCWKSLPPTPTTENCWLSTSKRSGFKCTRAAMRATGHCRCMPKNRRRRCRRPPFTASTRQRVARWYTAVVSRREKRAVSPRRKLSSSSRPTFVARSGPPSTCFCDTQCLQCTSGCAPCWASPSFSSFCGQASSRSGWSTTRSAAWP
eukprot:m.205663 g.205663  ORF g.205663 m.205663 type:complete len:402 (+) comp22022_c0_seq1:181-1386(+)